MQIRFTAAATFAAVLLASVALATPPGAGQHFDCSDGGDTSCAADDEGCVPADSSGLKCGSLAGKIIAKAVKGATNCHASQAEMRFDGASIVGAGTSEENCESALSKSVESKFNLGVAKLMDMGCDSGLVSGLAAYGYVLFGPGPFSFDALNSGAYCDSTSGAFIGDDDTGWVAATAGMLKCEISVAKALAKLQATSSKCHTKMAAYFLNGADFNEEECEEVAPGTHKGALEKFNLVRDKLVLEGICPPCLSASVMDFLAAGTIFNEDENNRVAFPCP